MPQVVLDGSLYLHQMQKKLGKVEFLFSDASEQLMISENGRSRKFTNQGDNMKKVTQILVIIIILLNCCLSFAGEEEDKKVYLQWLSTCKNYKDVGEWMAENFNYDKGKLHRHILATREPNTPRDLYYLYKPWTTFVKKGGVCGDAALFVKYSLNKIKPISKP